MHHTRALSSTFKISLQLLMCLALANSAWATSPSAQAVPAETAAAEAPEADATEPAGAGEEAVEEPVGDLGAESYLLQCSGCHTIGGGAMKGPDLIAATQWNSTELNPAIKRMEKHVGSISDAQVDLLSEFLQSPDVKERLAAEQARAEAEMAAKLDPPDADLGEALFFGSAVLSNGGMACAACHSVADMGGSMGPALDTLGAKTQGLPLISAIEKTAFPVMQTAYADHPVTKQEAIHIAAWFEAIAADRKVGAQHSANDGQTVLIIGGLIALAFILLVAAFQLIRGRAAGARRRLIADVTGR